jgi:hypothetical protein
MGVMTQTTRPMSQTLTELPQKHGKEVKHGHDGD